MVAGTFNTKSKELKLSRRYVSDEDERAGLSSLETVQKGAPKSFISLVNLCGT